MTSNDIDPAWWGRYSQKVKIIHRKQWNIDYSNDGWLTQQLLKILAAEQSGSAWSMVLDAKTIVVQPAELDRLFDDDGKLTWGYMPVFPVFEPARRIVSNLFDIDQTHVAGPAGVPFLFHTSTVSAMIKEVESRTGKSFAEWFQATGMVTEFMLYSGYVQYRDGSLDKLYTTTFNRPYGVCNVGHNETGIFDIKLKDMSADNNLTVSIHRNAWTMLDQTQRTNYRDFLINRGILQAVDLQ